jgi:hypothetical protein
MMRCIRRAKPINVYVVANIGVAKEVPSSGVAFRKAARKLALKSARWVSSGFGEPLLDAVLVAAMKVARKASRMVPAM